MRITILDGEPDSASSFSTYLSTLTSSLRGLGHSVASLELRALDLKGCTGCWNCWVRTPGECSKRDESATICRAASRSERSLTSSAPHIR